MSPRPGTSHDAAPLHISQDVQKSHDIRAELGQTDSHQSPLNTRQCLCRTNLSGFPVSFEKLLILSLPFSPHL